MQPGYSKGSDEEAGAAGHGDNEGAGDVSAIEEQKGVFTWRDVVYDIDMFVNGKPLDPAFQRSTGYVQQQDLHLETSTVREALQFSAMLRQPKTVSKKEKHDYVEEVIKMLNMSDFAEAVVGVPGEGLNVEQRKLLTIGVELAAKPKLLLFLDEPTSGLDSQVSISTPIYILLTIANFCTEFLVYHRLPPQAQQCRPSHSLYHPSAQRHSLPRVRPSPLPCPWW